MPERSVNNRVFDILWITNSWNIWLLTQMTTNTEVKAQHYIVSVVIAQLSKVYCQTNPAWRWLFAQMNVYCTAATTYTHRQKCQEWLIMFLFPITKILFLLACMWVYNIFQICFRSINSKIICLVDLILNIEFLQLVCSNGQQIWVCRYF